MSDETLVALCFLGIISMATVSWLRYFGVI